MDDLRFVEKRDAIAATKAAPSLVDVQGADHAHQALKQVGIEKPEVWHGRESDQQDQQADEEQMRGIRE